MSAPLEQQISSMSIQYRAASIEDAPVLAALHAATLEERWSEADLRAIFHRLPTLGILAFADTEAAGFGVATGVSGHGEIISLGVLDRFRRKGIATHILTSIASECRSRGAMPIVLEVAEDNKAAQTFYKNMGFNPVGRRRRYYRRATGPVDALVLRYDEPSLSGAS